MTQQRTARFSPFQCCARLSRGRSVPRSLRTSSEARREGGGPRSPSRKRLFVGRAEGRRNELRNRLYTRVDAGSGGWKSGPPGSLAEKFDRAGQPVCGRGKMTCRGAPPYPTRLVNQPSSLVLPRIACLWNGSTSKSTVGDTGGRDSSMGHRVTQCGLKSRRSAAFFEMSQRVGKGTRMDSPERRVVVNRGSSSRQGNEMSLRW